MSVDAAVVKNEDQYIPTIDLRDYFDAYSEKKRAKVIEQVRTACLEHGFFQVEGHAVPVESQRRMFAACKAPFDLPWEKKRRISLYKYSW
ncbi:hypothetical protein N7455_006194 [Penicillium solitum]|uniref:uncharacterized protein n=1 Tax=Penicillium solitum TaxID=60172 RepID=UPI0032C485BE|nr:hypothetical protein N7455_006194 [Penicillium solitum]